MKEYLRLFNPRGLKSLTFFVTGRCNASCKFCFYWQSNRNKEELGLEDIRKISKHLPHFFWLWLSGGEPFLRNDLPDLCRIFAINNKVSNIQIPTNGLLTDKIYQTTEQILVQCRRINLLIIVSIDDIGERHDELRGVKGNYDKAVETLERLKNLQKKYPRLSLQVTMTMSTFNQNRIIEIYKAVRQMVNSVSVNLVRGDVKEKIAKSINIERYVELHNYMLSDYDKYSHYRFPVSALVYAKDAVMREIIINTYKQNKRFVSCKALSFSIVLNETGELFPCEMMPRNLGDLTKTDFRNIRRANEDLERYITKECYCTHECSLTSSVIYSPRYFWNLIKYLIKFITRN